ncbi:OmpA family protein [Geoalkalibacter halelectricus]|uniref:OmpA family protein n=1 Tax=Geoalkalibacter halelectricus TaxID=2847045 RepID=A0ABY5ZLY0_9BACT|nr:OmpA family protein [Geoalkalibacter halelectricus]MDO3378615.1 OmpA family protein [Geoalkalibacter halelectricus]UWZ80073.1 OmpA family protein [Geoalkalibacter halelectricus]
MKKVLVLLMIAALAAAGCAQPPTKTQHGAAVGTGIGAAAGAGLGQAIGGDTRSTLIGAGIGAVVGGVTGGAIGRYMEQQEAALQQAVAGVEGASVQRNVNTIALTFKSDILFDINSATIKPGAYDEINRVANVLNQYPQTNILIAGHTDSTGSESYNQQLSERRAQSVKSALQGQGVSPMRMTTIGYGESRPIADNSTEFGRQLNRRVEITITPQG